MRRYEDKNMNKEISFLSLKNDLQEEIEIPRRKRGQNVCTCVERGYVMREKIAERTFFLIFIVHYNGMMIESEIKTKQPKTKASIYKTQNGKNEERKREKGNWNFKHLKIQSRFMIYRRIKKNIHQYGLDFVPCRCFTSGLKTHACQECESGGEKRGKTHTHTLHTIFYLIHPLYLRELFLHLDGIFAEFFFRTLANVYTYLHIVNVRLNVVVVDFRNF